MEDELKYSDFKSRLSMQDVLIDAGYHLNRRDGLRYPSFVRTDGNGVRISGDKFVVMPNGKSCFHPPEMKTFDIISFITEHPDLFREYRPGIHPVTLVNTVCNRLLNHPIDHTMHPIVEPHQNTKPFDIKDYKITQFQKLNFENTKQFYPFFKSRMINIDTQKAFSSSFVLAAKPDKGGKYRNLSFPLRIPGQSAIVGFEERGAARLDGTSGYKGKARGSNSSEGLWIASPNGTKLKDAKDVLWFESAYDAMAYYQLHAPKDKHLAGAVFLSTGGTPTVMQLRGVIKEAKNACHHLCFDNDMAGKQFVMNFSTELRHVRESLPKVGEDMKDYMESLYDNDDIYSGETDYLPKDLSQAYGKYESAAFELGAMKAGGLSHEDDIQKQTALVRQYHRKYCDQLKAKLHIGQEQGPLKSLGTYDIPEWALCAMENGDHEGLTDEEETVLREFMDEHFPDGYLADIDWDDYDEFNNMPAFGEKNENALTHRGEAPYLATKTYVVHFYHPSEREGYALSNLTVQREVPAEGMKDWNEQLIKEERGERKGEREMSASRELPDDQDKTLSAGLDMNQDGKVEITESEEKKHHHSMGR